MRLRVNSLQTLLAAGTPTAVKYTQIFDGKPYPITGSKDYASATGKRIDAATTETVQTLAGKVMQTQRMVLSKDGKTFTSTSSGTNAADEKVHNVSVYEKR